MDTPQSQTKRSTTKHFRMADAEIRLFEALREAYDSQTDTDLFLFLVIDKGTLLFGRHDWRVSAVERERRGPQLGLPQAAPECDLYELREQVLAHISTAEKAGALLPVWTKALRGLVSSSEEESAEEVIFSAACCKRTMPEFMGGLILCAHCDAELAPAVAAQALWVRAARAEKLRNFALQAILENQAKRCEKWADYERKGEGLAQERIRVGRKLHKATDKLMERVVEATADVLAQSEFIEGILDAIGEEPLDIFGIERRLKERPFWAAFREKHKLSEGELFNKISQTLLAAQELKKVILVDGKFAPKQPLLPFVEPQKQTEVLKPYCPICECEGNTDGLENEDSAFCTKCKVLFSTKHHISLRALVVDIVREKDKTKKPRITPRAIVDKVAERCCLFFPDATTGFALLERRVRELLKEADDAGEVCFEEFWLYAHPTKPNWDCCSGEDSKRKEKGGKAK